MCDRRLILFNTVHACGHHRRKVHRGGHWLDADAGYRNGDPIGFPHIDTSYWVKSCEVASVWPRAFTLASWCPAVAHPPSTTCDRLAFRALKASRARALMLWLAIPVGTRQKRVIHLNIVECCLSNYIITYKYALPMSQMQYN